MIPSCNRILGRQQKAEDSDGEPHRERHEDEKPGFRHTRRSRTLVNDTGKCTSHDGLHNSHLISPCG